MIESVTRERDELKSLAQTDVLTLESTLARVWYTLRTTQNSARHHECNE